MSVIIGWFCSDCLYSLELVLANNNLPVGWNKDAVACPSCDQIIKASSYQLNPGWTTALSQIPTGLLPTAPEDLPDYE